MDSFLQPYAKTVDVNQQLDKKVNVSDMRKPANDVAGIEEVNAKQDKLTITPADDSKVVHTADMRKSASDVVGLEDVPQAVVHSALASGVDLNTVVTPGVYPFAKVSFTNYIDNEAYWGYLIVTSEGNIVTQTMHNTSSPLPLYRMLSGSPAAWYPWIQVADDSKVAHLSGANNFDTVPTVNNNPLLLASSLPSDLARTGQANTFTQPQTFSIAPTITDASKDKGDNQAATMADLKSVKESAWLAIPDNKISLKLVNGNNINLVGSNCAYKLKPDEGKIYLTGGALIKGPNNGVNQTCYLEFDFSDIASKISEPDESLYMLTFGVGTDTGATSGIAINNTTLSFAIGYSRDGMIVFCGSPDFPYVNYTPKS